MCQCQSLSKDAENGCSARFSWLRHADDCVADWSAGEPGRQKCHARCCRRGKVISSGVAGCKLLIIAVYPQLVVAGAWFFTGGDDVALDTASACMGANVNQREVASLPLNGRQLSQLYLQAPGALNSSSGTRGDTCLR